MNGVESCQTGSIPAISFLVDDSNVPLCALCQSMLASDEESANVCGDCKFLLLEDFGSPSLHDPGHSRRRTRSTVIYRASGSESDTDNQLTIPIVTPDDGSRRWVRMFSDAESSGALYNSDSSLSLNGEGESNASFRIFYEGSDAISGGWESDTDYSLLEETNTLFLSSLARGDLYSDSDDIDPMHAGRINWDSEEEEEPQVRINEVSRRRRGNSSSGSSVRGGFEEYWLQQETGFWGITAAAAKSVVDGLPLVVIKTSAGDDDYGAKSKESNSEASSLSMCAICKDMFLLGSEALQLPCAHLYHPYCILPWLSTRNSCPVCRYELPTDDLEYEESWRINNNNGDNNASGLPQRHLGHGIESPNSSGGVVVEAREEEIIEQQEQLLAVREHVNDDDDDDDRPNSHHTDKKRWFSQVTAAAPVVSLVGLVFVILVGKPIIVTSRRRTNLNLPYQGGRWWQWRGWWF